MNKQLVVLTVAFSAVLIGLVGCYFFFTADFYTDAGRELIHNVRSIVPLHLYFSVDHGRTSDYIRVVIDCIFYFILVIGIVQYLSDNERSGILRFVLLMIFVDNVLLLLLSFYQIYNFVTYVLEHPDYEFSILWMVFSYVMSIFWVVGSFKALRLLGKGEQYEQITYGEGDEEHTVIQEQENGKRFWHMVLDSLVFTLITLKFIVGIGFVIEVGNGWESQVYLYFAPLVTFTICFSLSEFLFRASPAKYLTNSRVTNYYGENPSFGAVLLRSIIRFVPFDALSFLASAGWHDSWSKTSVVKKVNEKGTKN